MSGTDLGRYLDAVTAIAVEAGNLTLKYRLDPRVSEKGDHGDDTSPVTDADPAADQYITEHLAALDARNPSISKESKAADYATRKNWRSFWLAHPVDGTKESVRSSDDFTVNTALIENSEPVLGVIFAPAPHLSNGRTVVEGKADTSAEPEDHLNDLPVKERVSAGSPPNFCPVADGVADIYPRMNPTMEWDVAAGGTESTG